MKLRSDLHLVRKAYHFLGVLIIIGLYQVLTREQGVIAISIAAPLVLGLDILRLKFKPMNRLTYQLFGPFLRREEFDRLSGMSHLLTGALIVVAFFPKPVGMLAFLFLAFGDPISSIVGVLYGKDKILPNKSLQGTLAGFLVCAIVSAIYFQTHGLMQDRIVLASLVAGLIGALSELFVIWKLDDNFTIPVLGAIGLYFLFLFFGGFA